MINGLTLLEIYKKNPNFNKIANSKSLFELEKIIKDDKNLEIAKNATNCVFGFGVECADLLLVGEAPGQEEDRTGVPFCGRSGKFLDRLLENIDLSRKKNLYITNTVNWRPENNRVPTEEEILYCLPYLEKHIELRNPKLIATLGATAVFAILKRGTKPESFSMKNIIAKSYQYKNFFSRIEIPVFVLYHPSYMMRSHSLMPKFEDDFKKLRIEFDKITNNIKL